LRIELERQKSAADKAAEVRTNELGCFMTVCGVEIVHKFLAYKSAFALCYKMNNFITAAHFARLIVDLEPSGVSLALFDRL
jgi:Coatomer (COPI) alpha subunit C-terminus